jgi:chitinase
MKNIFSTYWAGYMDNTDITLDQTPKYIDIVNLAFIGPNKDSTVETQFLCLKYSADQIKEWINVCHENNIKVYISLLDTPDVHWDAIDLNKYAKNIINFVKEWNIDGIDIDAESDMNQDTFVKSFVNLILYLKKYNNTLPITYTCYTGTAGYDGDILNQVKDKIEYIQLMAYFDTYDTMIDLYNDYKQIMGDKIIIGVKAGEPDCTTIDEVKQLCLWNNKKKGIMLWTINRDLPFYTDNEIFTWADTINENLKNPLFTQMKTFLKENIFCYCLDFI